MTLHNSTAARVVSRLMRLTNRSGPVTSVQPRRKFFRTLTKIASISLLCAGFANVALASTVNNKSLPHESMAIQANLQIGVAAKATPTPSIAGNSGVLDFADYIQDRKTKGWSSAVYSKYEKEQVIGKLIIDLAGTIVESGKDTHGFYLALAVKAGDPKIDAYAYIPESDILNFSANQKVRLSGLIFGTWVQNLMIKDVVFSSGGKAPAKTATVTAANATAVPTKASVSGSGTKAKNNSTANANANLRSGPGTNYGVVGAIKKGDALTITGSDNTKKWFQLSDGNWVSASLVSNPPGNLSVVSAPPAPVAVATNAPVAVAVVASTATTVQQAAAVAPTAPAVVKQRFGNALNFNGSTYTVNAVVDPFVATNQFLGPDAGNRIIAVDITQEATQATDSFNAFYISVQATSGFIYKPGFMIESPEPDFSAGEITMGQTVRGWVSFEVPADALIVTVMAKGDVFGPNRVIADLRTP